ncbi:hypothetical protein TNCV_5026601 [Trichonephila clavipes]|uniref:Uncharacterized protein n=1 Tax=Trichonephila clavipes TaxID=2585209 RepID=A0A8X6RV01_TRICX|nr:hypothetical protein TNCV_5026601 [Trichonephila clavipes]
MSTGSLNAECIVRPPSIKEAAMPGTRFPLRDALVPTFGAPASASPLTGKGSLRSSGIIRQSYGNFSDRISDSDCPFRITSGTKFTISKAFKVSSRQGPAVFVDGLHTPVASGNPHRKNSSGVRSGERGDQYLAPLFPIIWPT